MVSPDRFPENPHIISFSNQPLGIHTEINIDSPVMEQLPPEDRVLLEKLVVAQSYSLALLIKTRECGIDRPSWRNHIIDLLHETDDITSNIDAEIDHKQVANLLGVNLEVPPSYEQELHSITPPGAA